MRGALSAALLLALASSARAATVQYKLCDRDASRAGRTVFSHDGYHWARIERDARNRVDLLMMDCREVLSAPAGTLTYDYEENGTAKVAVPEAALSADGKVLLHQIVGRGENGETLYFPAINGKKIGRGRAKLQTLLVSADGSNAAYVASTPQGWSVESAQGAGPSFPDAPVYVFVSNADVLYLADWQRGHWIYRGKTAPASTPSLEISASPDLSRVGEVDESDGQQFVRVGAEKSGPWEIAALPVFSADGKHYAFAAARASRLDTVVVDGAPVPAPEGYEANSMAVDARGRAYWYAAAGTPYRDGKPLPGTVPASRLNPTTWIGLSPSGAHRVYPVEGGLRVDDAEVKNIDPPLYMAPLAFDGEREFHYLIGDRRQIALVCGTVDGSEPGNTRCARVASEIAAGRKAGQ